MTTHPKSSRSAARWGLVAAAVIVATAAVLLLLSAGPATGDVRELTERYMEYNRTIQLSPEQHAVFKEALDALPAPCCEDNPATTCCCPCNQAKTWWGLAKHLIAEQGAGAEAVREAVAEWMETTHPKGAAGDACYRGRCPLPFAEDGCGGMSESDVAF